MNYRIIVKAAVCAVIIAVSFAAFDISFSLIDSVHGYVVSEDGSSAVKVGSRVLLFNDNGEMTMPLNIDAGGEGFEIFQANEQNNSFCVRTFRSENYYEYDFQGNKTADLGHLNAPPERKASAVSGNYSLIYEQGIGKESLYLMSNGNKKELQLGKVLIADKLFLPLTFSLIAAAIGFYIICLTDKSNSLQELLHSKIRLNTDLKEAFSPAPTEINTDEKHDSTD